MFVRELSVHETLEGYYECCRNSVTKQENAFINLGCIFVAIRDRLGSIRLLTHPVDTGRGCQQGQWLNIW